MSRHGALPLLFAAALLLSGGCQGTSPKRYGEAALGFGAVLIRARLILPDGETRIGSIAMNLESANDSYRLVALPDQTSLLRIEPDKYRLGPTRNMFGMLQKNLKVRIGNRVYVVPFPRDILRKDRLNVRPTKIVAIGYIEARLLPIQRGREPRVEVRLDDSVASRRRLIEDIIQRQMDHRTPTDIRDNLISWTRSLEQLLIQVQGEQDNKASYKFGTPDVVQDE
ncbi:MAG: hypothetical protein A2X36_05190 [Elusimicrobia bacterium GWA2_69_24]|nr:MAG: hypothetical protein A2X36_05190 [Elusimicrobia bacterium GWA2_69_24]